jgi:FAD binding domain-containing protein/berberine-like enzyme
MDVPRLHAGLKRPAFLGADMKSGTTRREILRTAALAGASVVAPAVFIRTGAASAYNHALAQTLAAQLHGKLIRPTDKAYDAARKLWNGRFDKRPALIARCADDDDVSRTLAFARSQHLPVAIRSGGHSYAGLSSSDGSIVIDLSAMNRVEVDAARRIAHVQPGATAGKVEAALHGTGLVVPLGQCPQVGVGGLASGGGEGILASTLGVTSDQVSGANVFLADGRQLKADHHTNAELLWGVCGGGGNLGIVTSFELALHPLPACAVATTVFKASKAHDGLLHLRDFLMAMPDDGYGQMIISNENGHARVDGFACHARADGGDTHFLSRMASLPGAEKGNVARVSYAQAQRLSGSFDHPVGVSSHLRSCWVDALSDTYLGFLAKAPPPPVGFVILSRVGGTRADASAYPLRKRAIECWIEAQWRTGAANTNEVNWVNEVWEQTAQFSIGRYVNGLENEPDAVRIAYGSSYERLARLKRKYDPQNVFHVNQNIAPAV